MKQITIIGLAGLIASSCLKPLDERAVEISMKDCESITINSVHMRNLDLPADGEYLTLSQIKHVDEVLQEKTDCRLSVYLDILNGDRDYLVQKKDSKYIKINFPKERYTQIYPFSN